MANPRVVIEGRLGGDPELRFTPSGKEVASMRVATNDRKRDDGSGQWSDVDTTWWTVTAWGDLAKNIVESLVKGDLALIHGRVRDRSWEDQSGATRTEKEIVADAVGPSLRFRVQRHGEPSQPTGNAQQGQPQGQQQGAQGNRGYQPQDPWGSPPPQSHPNEPQRGQQQPQWAPPQDQEPPF